MHLFACGFWRLKSDSDPADLVVFLADRGLTLTVSMLSISCEVARKFSRLRMRECRILDRITVYVFILFVLSFAQLDLVSRFDFTNV